MLARFGRLVLAAAAGVAVLAGCSVASQTPAAASSATCRHIAGPFHRYRNEILNARGQRFIPYGITITGLGNPNWPNRANENSAEITASAGAWCSNVDRFQFFQDGLVNPKTYQVNATFLADLEASVNQALSLGLVAAINDQSEGAAAGTEYMPDKQSRVFWKAISAVYGHNPDVVFDLFNEPRRTVYRSNAATWRFWRNGGRFQGVRYMGMEPLARYVRSLGARNLLWVEGPHTASTLGLVTHYQLAKVGAVEYGVNHAGTHNKASPQTPAYWQSNFGYAARTVPVVNTEWTTYAKAGGCSPDAPRVVPVYLRFLASHGIGMTAWTLAPGVLAASSNLDDPTRFKSNWACKDGLDEGAGHQVMSWFDLHNG